MCQLALGNHCKKTRQKVQCWALKRSQGNKVKYDPAHTGQRCSSTSIRETDAGRFAFSGQGGKGQMSSAHSGSISDKLESGKPTHVDPEQSESVSDKPASAKLMLVTQ